MTNWTGQRKLSLAIHVLFIALPLGMATAAAFTWWSALFGDPWMAAGLITTLEVLALTSLALYIVRIEWPLAWLRQVIPFFSVIPLGRELYTYLEPNTGVVWAVVAATAMTAWFVWIAFTLLRSLEHLFISPLEAVKEYSRQRMESLALTLGEWQTASQAVQGFAETVVGVGHQTQAPLLLDTQATMPVLQTSTAGHPKMSRIAGLAALRATDGTWAMTSAAIQQDTRVSFEVVDVIVRLVRSGQLMLVEATDEPSVE